ncbi:P-loop containing nucleoside triphosphate hydrolase protein [Suillus subalutaceus]|uniref:P-loop containing nucleoside triphosphate hydrolase protein n=1 Tax=Suillus subalutaceus TaxID=48586 RepID=UPI001B8827EC|nr:P-loop containing nucleoside triphosphate hydrolase protein [Suillus subalutaceus]KAG1836508.1 P-loop containing nucleoside triphosphate hydrolase protein [Suillus subalutaceus]
MPKTKNFLFQINASVIARVDRGKSTLAHALIPKVIIAAVTAGDMRLADSQDDGKEHGITIKSTAISIYFEMEKEDVEIIKQKTEGRQRLGVLDRLDRLTCVQTETALHQARMVHIKPVVIINKVDRALLGLQISEEDLSSQARFAGRFGAHKDKLLARLWGDNYFNSAARKWGTKASDAKVNTFVLNPIFMIFDDLEGNALLKVVMRKFLPAGDSLLETTIINLSSPASAQRSCVKTLYEGLSDDERRPLRIRDACGLAFSGTVRSGPEIHIQGPDYEPGNKADLFVKSVQYTALMMGHYMESIQDRPTGNFCGLVSIDQFLLKSGTIITSVTAHDARVMKFSASTAVEVAVECPRSASPFLPVPSEKSQSHDRAQAGVPLKISECIVGFGGTVKAESSIVGPLSKSQNKRNHLHPVPTAIEAPPRSNIKDTNIRVMILSRDATSIIPTAQDATPSAQLIFPNAAQVELNPYCGMDGLDGGPMAILCLGGFSGGEAYFTDLKLKLPYRSGDVLIFSAGDLYHAVGPWKAEGGVTARGITPGRIGNVFFSPAHSLQALKDKSAGWMKSTAGGAFSES